VAFCKEVLEHCSGFKKVIFLRFRPRHQRFEPRSNARTRADRAEVVRSLGSRKPVRRGRLFARIQRALESGSDWILEIDAGFSHQPRDIPQFFDAMEEEWIACSEAGRSVLQG